MYCQTPVPVHQSSQSQTDKKLTSLSPYPFTPLIRIHIQIIWLRIQTDTDTRLWINFAILDTQPSSIQESLKPIWAELEKVHYRLDAHILNSQMKTRWQLSLIHLVMVTNVPSPKAYFRATEGTSLYVWVRQSVSSPVSALLFFKTHISPLLEHAGRWNFGWKLHIMIRNEQSLKNKAT